MFFAAVFAGHWAIPSRRGRHILLLIASYLFYMSWNVWLISLILFSTLLDFFVGMALARVEDGRRRKGLLAVSLVGNLGVLAVFKYADFFVLSLRELLLAGGVHTDLTTLGILLPVGISFYTFQTLSYTVDIYRRRTAPCRDPIAFALFVAFFPQLVAGPIVKAHEFLPQLAERTRFDWRRIERGAVLLLIGLTKKTLIADNLAMLVDPVFADPTAFVTRDLWLAMFCYGGQIYCDFSGYSDMAIALAGMLGYDLPLNFASPYLAVGLSDFWRRWHISLSTWLRDYLYIPLGGSRCSRWCTRRNLMITMLLGGLWHGASWTFVVWGALHGVALVVFRRSRREGDRSAARGVSDSPPPAIGLDSRCWLRRLRVAGAWGLTLLTVHVAWVFFRCRPLTPPGALEPEPATAALTRASYYVAHLFVPATVAEPTWLPSKLPMLVLLLLMAVMQFHEEWVRRGRPIRVLPAPVAGVGYAAWIVVLVLFSSGNTVPFIYFQF